MQLLIVTERPPHTGTLGDIHDWMRASATAEAWIQQNPTFGRAFARYMASQEPDHIRRVFGIEPVCQLKPDGSIRGRGHHLFALKDFEDALWIGFTASLNRNH